MEEALSQLQVTLISREFGKLGERVVHSPVLAGEHSLEGWLVHILQEVDRPVSQLLGDVERLVIVGATVGVQQAGKELVDGVPRNPTSVEVETLAPHVSPFELGPDRVLVGNAPDVAGAPFGLA